MESSMSITEGMAASGPASEAMTPARGRQQVAPAADTAAPGTAARERPKGSGRVAGLAVAALVGVLAIAGWAASHSSKGGVDPRPPGTSTTGWVEHRPAGAGYTVAFPGTPKSMTQDVPTPAGPVA